MQLLCHKCGNRWDESLTESAAMVQCPACFAAVPVKLARPGSPAASARPAAAAGASTPEPPREDTRAATLTPPPQEPPDDIYGAETILDFGGAATFPPPGKKDPSATATVSPFDQTVPATDSLRPSSPAAPPPDDSLFEAHDTLRSGDQDTIPVGSFDLTEPAAPPQARTQTLPFQLPPDESTGEMEIGGAPAGAATKAFAMAGAKEVDLTGQTVRGYRVTRMLGAGGMGAVCLARQISLDRDVALKILPGRLAQNPEFLVRFTREALSAAQLTHHNIIQVYDVGSDSEIHYIAMEYVRGNNLGDMVRRDGQLRVEDAASFILQAARGLKYAHDRGIIHRDIKPDNLMVNEHGIVKIADMGLAKMRGEVERSREIGDAEASILARARGDLTMVDVAMGTPAYMPPEQARDASSVDHRADQYSLGCTLYYLVAGTPPYSGSSAFEVISKHKEAPTPALEEQVRNVPGSLSAIVRRMLAKNPDERYPDMAAVIQDLEAVLGLEAEKGPYTPRERHLELLEREQIRYDSAPSLKWRKLAPVAFVVSTVVLAALSVFSGELGLAGGFLGLMVLTPVFSFVLGGITHKTYLFRRVRNIFFGMPWKEWVAVGAGSALAVAVLVALNLIWWWAGFAVVAAALAAGYQLAIVRRVDRERANPLGTIQEMLKHLRLKGVGEDAIQDFVCRFSGEHWEEMFEALFGYEAMIEARARIAATDHLERRKHYATWREPIARWLDGVEESRRIRREKQQLARVEARRLKAHGASAREANKRARAAAARMHEDIKVVASRPPGTKSETAVARKVRPRHTPHIPTPADNAFRALRFVAGSAMLVYFVVSFFGSRLPGAVQPAVEKITSLPLPSLLQVSLFNWWSGVAAFLLIVSSVSVRRLTGIMVALGAGAVAGVYYIHPLLEQFGILPDAAQFIHLALAVAAAGLAVAVLGKMAGREF